MNIWKSTGEKNLPFPQWVERLAKENQELLKKLKKYEDRERAKRRTGSGEKTLGEDEKGGREGMASEG